MRVYIQCDITSEILACLGGGASDTYITHKYVTHKYVTHVSNICNTYVSMQCGSTSTMLTYVDGGLHVCVTPNHVTRVSVTRVDPTHISHKCTTYAYVQCDSTSASGLSWRCVRNMCNTYFGVSDIYVTGNEHMPDMHVTYMCKRRVTSLVRCCRILVVCQTCATHNYVTHVSNICDTYV